MDWTEETARRLETAINQPTSEWGEALAADIRAALAEILRLKVYEESATEWQQRAAMHIERLEVWLRAEVDAERIRKTAEAKALREALLRRGLSGAPCDVCGYAGPGYWQPDTHACVAARAALAGKAEGGER
jgi:hypothetical protein